MLGGCGGGGHRSSQPPRGPTIPRDLASGLAARSDAVAAALARGDCAGARELAQRLQQETIRSIGRVPPRLVEDLQGGVNVLVDDIRCAAPAPVPAPAPATATATTGTTTTAETSTEEAPPGPPAPPGHGHGKGHAYGHGKHGHGKHGGGDQGDQGD